MPVNSIQLASPTAVKESQRKHSAVSKDSRANSEQNSSENYYNYSQPQKATSPIAKIVLGTAIVGAGTAFVLLGRKGTFGEKIQRFLHSLFGAHPVKVTKDNVRGILDDVFLQNKDVNALSEAEVKSSLEKISDFLTFKNRPAINRMMAKGKNGEFKVFDRSLLSFNKYKKADFCDGKIVNPKTSRDFSNKFHLHFFKSYIKELQGDILAYYK